MPTNLEKLSVTGGNVAHKWSTQKVATPVDTSDIGVILAEEGIVQPGGSQTQSDKSNT